jgi:hypothetical protein
MRGVEDLQDSRCHLPHNQAYALEMKEFTVNLANRPGMLASLTETLTEAGVAIEALAAFGLDDEGYVRVIVDNAEATRQALRAAGLGATERKILTMTLPHRPASLSEMTRSLAESGVNIEAMYLLNSCADGMEFAVAVDDPDRARLHLQS